MKDTGIKNLSIGLVVEANIYNSNTTPGYTLIRKIVYKDYGDFGTDMLYKNKGVPIIYPIVDFRKSEDLALISNGEYVILEYGIVTNYLRNFGITLNKKISSFDKFKIKNLIFKGNKVIDKPLLVREKINSELLANEIETLSDFKIYNNPDIPNLSEYVYLENLTGTKVYYR